jgi:predicted component of type VI protein secretion system
VDLIRLEGPAASDRFEVIAAQAVIGRAPDCDVVVFDPQASRRHARIRRVGPDFVVEALQEANPTVVNDRLLEGARRLVDGDLIVVGGVVFLVELDRPTPLADDPSAYRVERTEAVPRMPAAPILPAATAKPSEATHEVARRIDAAARRLQARASALAPHSRREHSASTAALDALIAVHEKLGGDEELARLAGILRDRLSNQTDIRALYRLGHETETLLAWMRLARESIAQTTKLAAALDLR